MNNRYMDFVPKHVQHISKKAPKNAHQSSIAAIHDLPKSSTPTKEKIVASGSKTFSIKKSSSKNSPDYNTNFVNTSVEKRPLSSQNSILAKAKAEKIKNRTIVSTSKSVAQTPKSSTPSKTPFIPTSKLNKRPLSKNFYQKQPPVSTDESFAPVAIVDNPDKESRVGTIIAIILTIILGAVVGTVAFLLLPR